MMARPLTDAEIDLEVNAFLGRLAALRWHERGTIFAKLRWNRTFCFECGTDTPDGRPCPCANDE